MVGHNWSCSYSKQVCIWEVSGLIGGTPVALIESPGRYWVSNPNDAMTA
jgi:hypothetical protein